MHIYNLRPKMPRVFKVNLTLFICISMQRPILPVCHEILSVKSCENAYGKINGFVLKKGVQIGEQSCCYG